MRSAWMFLLFIGILWTRCGWWFSWWSMSLDAEGERVMIVDWTANTGAKAAGNVNLPAATTWPIVLAFGITLAFAGLVTSWSVSVLGAVLAINGAVGWFRNVLPHEAHESVPVLQETLVIETRRREVARVALVPDLKRAWLPLEIYPVSAGIKGGLAGGRPPAAFGFLFSPPPPQNLLSPPHLSACAP